MKLYYIVISIFLTLFFSRQITQVICFGRYRDQQNIKTKRSYWLIYGFWTLFFFLLCLMMGSAAHVDHTFDYGMKTVEMYTGNTNYFEGETIYAENDYKKNSDFTLEYYVKKCENIEIIMKQIIEENTFIYRAYNLSDISIVQKSGNTFDIYVKDEIFATMDVEKKFLNDKLNFHWNQERLNQNINR